MTMDALPSGARNLAGNGKQAIQYRNCSRYKYEDMSLSAKVRNYRNPCINLLSDIDFNFQSL